MRKGTHPENGLLIRYLDGELGADQSVRIVNHLHACAVCSEKLAGYEALSGELATTLQAAGPTVSCRERARLAEALEEHSGVAGANRILGRFAWGMAVAAMLALALLLAPERKWTAAHTAAPAAKRQVASLDVNGESFIALPYSNPDLPLNASRIVEMEIPASALAEAGIAFVPPPNASSDAMVAANVLLGIDGQPLGLHVLGMN